MTVARYVVSPESFTIDGNPIVGGRGFVASGPCVPARAAAGVDPLVLLREE